MPGPSASGLPRPLAVRERLGVPNGKADLTGRYYHFLQADLRRVETRVSPYYGVGVEYATAAASLELELESWSLTGWAPVQIKIDYPVPRGCTVARPGRGPGLRPPAGPPSQCDTEASMRTTRIGCPLPVAKTGSASSRSISTERRPAAFKSSKNQRSTSAQRLS